MSQNLKIFTKMYFMYLRISEAAVQMTQPHFGVEFSQIYINKFPFLSLFLTPNIFLSVEIYDSQMCNLH